MPDAAPALLRRWRLTRDDADGVTWLVARVGAGEVRPAALSLAAWAGFAPARALLGAAAPEVAPWLVPAAGTGGGAFDRRDVRKALFPIGAALDEALARWAGDASGPWRAEVCAAWCAALGARAPAADAASAGPRLWFDVGLALARRPDGGGAAGPRVWAELGAAVVRVALAAPGLGPEDLARGRPAPGPSTVALTRTPEVDPAVLARAAALLSASGAVAVRLGRDPLRLPAGREARWAALGAARPAGAALAVAVTTAPDPLGWFAATAPGGREVTVHLDPASRACVRARPSTVVAHLVLARLLGTALPPGHHHERARGCAFDLCREKPALDARLRAGRVCPACRADLAARLGARLPALEDGLAAVARTA